jgi:peptide/nickel transport system permease protein
MKLWVYIVRRLLLLIPVIIGVMTITFILIQALPVSTRIISYIGGTKNPCGLNPECVPGQGACPQTSPTNCPNGVYLRAVQAIGADKPVPVQWGIYIYNSLTLQWGATNPHSYATGSQQIGGTSVPIVSLLGWYLPYTLELAALSLLIILVLAIPIGNYSAVYRNRPFDQGARVLSFSGFAFPGFLLAVLILFAAVDFISGGLSATYCNGLSFAFNQWYGSWADPNCLIGTQYPSWIGQHQATSPTGFPTIDAVYHALTDSSASLRAQDWFLAADSVRRMILPALVIAFGAIAGILRFVRNSMLEVMNLDFIRTARSKGVPESRVVSYHAGRNSLNVTVTVLGLTFAAFIAGFPIIEEVFHLNGIGLLLVLAIQPSIDFGLVFATTLLFTFIVVFANLVVDILYAYLDPRVRLG